ncbi:MAG: hypothetical protein JXJ04_07165 [Spirochaetales bacterium]|nr:hypothetical protein [Spirochaetales bacterium]
MSNKISSFLSLFAVFCVIVIAGCSFSPLSENDTDVVSGISRGYGEIVTAAGMVNEYCYYASDLESKKSLAQQRAIESWESYTKTSWSTAADKYFTWRVNPTFTGPGVYFVYVQASGRPLVSTPSYGEIVTAAGMVNEYCYYASDLESKKSLAQQKAIASWESYTKSSWSKAKDKYFTWRVNPTFTGPAVYFIYVQASGRPLLQ